jgi:hypothetical protein
MSAPQPVFRPLPHIIGEGYSFDEVRAALGGDAKPPNFVIHKEGAVIGVCLGMAWNPRAENEPCEVWVGRKEGQAEWGIKLAETSGPLPVYVRRTEGGPWFYNGLYKVSDDTTDPRDIRPRLMPPKIVAIAQVILMSKVAG